jgi:hypothetical protein
MANVYEISSDQIPQLLLVVSDDLKVPVDIFSTEMDTQTVLDFDSALKERLISYSEIIISNNHTNSTIAVISSLARMRKSFRELYSAIFA